MMISRILNSLMLTVIGLYIVLNYGFMQLRIPPITGGGVPIAEIILILTLAVIDYSKLLPKLSEIVFLLPFLIWWGLGIGRAIVGVPEFGMWALRDATHVIESLFLLVGFAVAASLRNFEAFFSWMPKILVIVVVYALSYPFSKSLALLSPILTAGGGHPVPLLFNYIGISLFLLLAAFYLLIFKCQRGTLSALVALLTAVFILLYAISIFQARTLYIQIIAIMLFFTFYRRNLLASLTIGMFLLVLGVVILSFFDVQIKGRLGVTMSLDFLFRHFLAIAGVSSVGLEGSAGGVDQRIGWWLDIYDRWTSGFDTFVIGRGYGFPLVDFVAKGDVYAKGGQLVREPHNSYISIIARIGIMGIIAFLWMHLLMIGAWWRTYKQCARLQWREGENRLLILMVFFILVWVNAMTEDAFEKPFFAIPYYFFWGVMLRFTYHLKKGLIGPKGENCARSSCA